MTGSRVKNVRPQVASPSNKVGSCHQLWQKRRILSGIVTEIVTNSGKASTFALYYERPPLPAIPSSYTAPLSLS